MLLLIDENVPDSVSDVFRSHGHEVRLVRDVLLPGTPDHVVAAIADAYGAIVVTWNIKDFRKLGARRQSDQTLFKRLGRLNFRCRESQGKARAEAMLSRIEFEFLEVQKLRDKRLMITITETTFTVVR